MGKSVQGLATFLQIVPLTAIGPTDPRGCPSIAPSPNSFPVFCEIPFIDNPIRGSPAI